MENQVINKKVEIADILKVFKELISLHSDKIKDLPSYEYYFQNIEEDIEDEDENDLDYLENLHFNLVEQFKNFFIEYNIDYTPKNKQPIIFQKKSTINNNLKETTNNNNFKKSTINNSTFIETPEWLKLKRSVLNSNNKDNKCFQYSITLSLCHEQIGKNFCRISVIKPLINNLNWENINSPQEEQDYKTLEINNKSIALNILQFHNEQKMNQLYKSEHNRTRENKVILLILEDKHYVAVKNLNSLLKDKNKVLNTFVLTALKILELRKDLKNIISQKIVNHCHNRNLNQFHNQ